jgi:chemotaxis protein CheC
LARILVVDDSATSRAIASSLIGPDHEIAEAGSGQAALDMLDAGSYDLVLLDLLMPGMGGLEVLSQMAARGIKTPAIVATADIQRSTRERALSLGAAGLINKPLKKEVLDAAILVALRPASGQPPAPASLPLEAAFKDAFEELMNIAIGRAAEVLNTMLSSHIALSAPSIELVSAQGLSSRFASAGARRLSTVEMRCAGALEAEIKLIFTSEDAARLADCVIGVGSANFAVPVDRDSMRAGALCEIGNIVINAVLGTISNALEIDLAFSVPSYLEGSSSALFDEIALSRQAVILLVRTTFEVEKMSINGDIALFLSMASFESLTSRMEELGGPRP